MWVWGTHGFCGGAGGRELRGVWSMMLTAYLDGGAMWSSAPCTTWASFVFRVGFWIWGRNLRLASIFHRVSLRCPPGPPWLPGTAGNTGSLPRGLLICCSLQPCSERDGLHLPVQEYLQQGRQGEICQYIEYISIILVLGACKSQKSKKIPQSESIVFFVLIFRQALDPGVYR